MMTATYSVTLINLAADARSVATAPGKIDRPGLAEEEMRTLLRNFCELDAIENATADPEIRVHASGRNWLIRAGQKQLILYDILNREAPGHLLTPDEVMAELDGTANATRSAAPFVPPAWAQVEARDERPRVISRPAPKTNARRLVVLGLFASSLLAAVVYLRVTAAVDDTYERFARMPAAEAASALASLAGVYVTGTHAGGHGIVLSKTGELRLIEFRVVDAPRVVHATVEIGRVENALCLSTDQPGGLIRMPDPDNLVYCGETYKRVP